MTRRRTKAELTELPTKKFHAHVESGGDWSDGAQRGRPPRDPSPVVLPMAEDPDALVPTSVRLPTAMLAAISERVGRDRDGRSGLIRAAVDEYFRNHPTNQYVALGGHRWRDVGGHRCRDERCRQGFATDNDRDDHELAARHWDEETT